MESGTDLFSQANAENTQEVAASPQGMLASFLNKALTGAQAGAASGRQMRVAQGEREIANQGRIVEMQQKLQQMKIEAENQRISENMAKKFGFLPLDPGEADSVRGAALSGMAKKNPPTDPTSAGRIATIMIGNDEYGPVPDFSPKTGMSFKFEKQTTKKDAASAAEAKQATIKAKAYEIAVAAAKRDKFNTVSTLSSDPNVITKFADVQPTEDEIQKYVPEAVSYLNGDSKGSAAARKKRTLEAGTVDTALKEMQGQIEDLQGRSGIRNALTPGDQGAELQSLTQRRDALLKGGGLPIVDQHYRAEAKKITDKVKAKKATPEDMARLKDLTKKLMQVNDLGGQ